MHYSLSVPAMGNKLKLTSEGWSSTSTVVVTSLKKNKKNKKFIQVSCCWLTLKYKVLYNPSVQATGDKNRWRIGTTLNKKNKKVSGVLDQHTWYFFFLIPIPQCMCAMDGMSGEGQELIFFRNQYHVCYFGHVMIPLY